MPEIFETLMYAARRELVITTPYYVPDESLQTRLCPTELPRRGHDDHLPGEKRLVDRGSGQPQLLRELARRRGQDSSSTRVASCTPNR